MGSLTARVFMVGTLLAGLVGVFAMGAAIDDRLRLSTSVSSDRGTLADLARGKIIPDENASDRDALEAHIREQTRGNRARVRKDPILERIVDAVRRMTILPGIGGAPRITAVPPLEPIRIHRATVIESERAPNITVPIKNPVPRVRTAGENTERDRDSRSRARPGDGREQTAAELAAYFQSLVTDLSSVQEVGVDPRKLALALGNPAEGITLTNSGRVFNKVRELWYRRAQMIANISVDEDFNADKALRRVGQLARRVRRHPREGLVAVRIADSVDLNSAEFDRFARALSHVVDPAQDNRLRSIVYTTRDQLHPALARNASTAGWAP